MAIPVNASVPARCQDYLRDGVEVGATLQVTVLLMDALVEKVRLIVPELLELNGGLEPGQKMVNILVRADHEEAASVSVES
jgi:hypothetical protein